MSIQERPNEMRNWSIVMITFLLLLLLSLAVTIYLTYQSFLTYLPSFGTGTIPANFSPELLTAEENLAVEKSKIRNTNRDYLNNFCKIIFIFCLTLDITSLFTLYTEDIKNTNTAIIIVSVLSVITLLWYLFWWVSIQRGFDNETQKMSFMNFMAGSSLTKQTFTIITLSLWTLLLFSVSYFLYIKNVLGSILKIKETNNIYIKTIFSLTVINDFLLLILIIVTIRMLSGDIYKYGGKLYNKYISSVKEAQEDGEFSEEFLDKIEAQRSNNSLVRRISDMITNII
jgi:hypothetical protein